MVETHLAEEAKILPNALWLPLGPKASEAILHLAAQGLLDHNKVLTGLPHPSGANNERIAIFTGQKDHKTASSKTNGLQLVNAANRLKQQVKHLTPVL